MPKVIVRAAKREHFNGYFVLGRHIGADEQEELTVTAEQLAKLQAEPKELLMVVVLPDDAEDAAGASGATGATAPAAAKK